MRRLLLLIVLSLLIPLSAHAQPVGDRVGDAYEVRWESRSEHVASDGSSSGSSNSRNTLVERVVAISDAGVELEFDLLGATPEDRARSWQFPVRVFKASDGSLRLLNGSELEQRVQAWLVRGGIPSEACGRWIFTWTAIKIECDPQSVIAALARFDLRPAPLIEGAMYREMGVSAAAPLRTQSLDSGGAQFVAEMELDGEAVRRERAESDVIVAQMMGESPLSLEDALARHADERISGTVVTTFETDSAGRVVRRSRVTQAEIVAADGTVEHHTTTETVVRSLLSSGGDRP